MHGVQEALERLVSGHHLAEYEAYDAFAALMDGQCQEVQIAALLTALRVKGETVDEIVGAARVLRERAIPITSRHARLLDTCGTGGDRLHTFNISTAAALVVAAAGIPVAKHGNRGVSSSSGSADVLEQLGVNINLTPPQVSRCLDDHGIGFCFAPLLHGAMKHAAPVRKQLKFRTIFNCLGPLVNPARAGRQLVGTSGDELGAKLAAAIARLGTQHSIIVCGCDGLDEVSLWGTTTAFDVADGQVNRQTWTAATFGLEECAVEDLQVDSPAESASVLRRIFSGEGGPARNIVLANAAAALLAAGHTRDPREAVALGAAALDSGRVRDLLGNLVTQSTAPPAD